MASFEEDQLEDRFIRLLQNTGILLTGNFKLKSGRFSPYFLDFGRISDPKGLSELGRCYAEKINRDIGLDKFDLVFGPAYKGIPIALATASALFEEFNVSKGFAFNRKVEKEYGEKSLFLGHKLTEPLRALIVDDVITDGGAKYETIDLLRQHSKLELMGVLVGVDRSESPDVIQTFTSRTGLPIWSITMADKILQRSGAEA